MRRTIDKSILKFMSDQLSVWPLAASNFRALKSAETRRLAVGGLDVLLQHNPARITSSTAKSDPESVAARPCFLCAENCPEEQLNFLFDGRKGRRYFVRANPYPIFSDHLVISSVSHEPQSIWRRYVDMLDLAQHFDDFCIFYNGPQCGASAPDHMHFQACPKGLMPLENDIEALFNGEDASGKLKYLSSVRDADLYHYEGFTRGVFALRAKTSKSLAKLFYRLLDCAPVHEGSPEPMFNLFAYCSNGEYRSFVTFRDRHFSHHFDSDGPDHLTMGPGAADMAGFLIVPVAEDYEKLNSGLLEEMLSEVSLNAEDEEKIIWKLTRSQAQLRVGIMSAPEIAFEMIADGAGTQKVRWSNGQIDYNGNLYDELFFEAGTPSTMFAEASFILHDVVIGVDFHWQRKVDQKFAGSLKFIVEGDRITAVNVIGIEDYLLSVISSEMKSTASLEYLKAHSVISRSWVMSQIRGHKQPGLSTGIETDETYIKWFDHDDHVNFDVCADDHCQRYQGIGMAAGDTVRKAIDATWGQVLMYEGEICDARFSKCCGGMMETFDTCWEDAVHPYLQAIPDRDADGKDFCDTDDQAILSQVLNDYDLETRDFYKWQVRYTKEELSELIRRRSGIDFGTVEALEPLERGGSGRLKLLRVVGSKRSMKIGKELIIRRWLSESHLKSSAFDVSREGDSFVLDGKGWGHGVGFCQIGAAVMSAKGYSYDAILSHYYPGSELKLIQD